nr:unnamed protein product [Digitaria exilis]
MMIPSRNMPTTAAMIGGLHSYATSFGQNMMDGQHQLAVMQQQHQNHVQQQAATSESDARGQRHDELMMIESKSGSDNIEGGAGSGSGGEELQEDLSLQRPRKKRYHRHTQHQIQELEAFFKEFPHPDDKQRKELSRELGLEPLQVKFWFQNKRTQMKTQQERHENTQLRAENDKLRAENARYKEALANAACPNCGGPATAVIGEMSFDEHHLRIENARLHDEIDRISAIAAKYVGKPINGLVPNSSNISSIAAPYPPQLSSHSLISGGAADMFGGLHHRGVTAAFDKPLVIELAVAAMEELIRMAQQGEPLWVPALVDGTATEALNEEEYARTFPRGVGPKSPELRSEASRDTVVVIMNHVNLVEMLMDVNQWSTLFSSIVSRAATLEVLSTGVAGNYNGALQLMTAEFQMPSPLVPTRESHFVRYCKQHTDGSWAVVDVSLDGLRAGGATAVRGRRRPSGCLIREMPNGYSRVTWVEHVEADDAMVHDLYRPLVSSGLAFGARRWAAALERQCERLASAMASGVPAASPAGGDAAGVVTSAEGRRSMLRLAERMVASFCGGVTASTTHQWTTLSGSGPEDVRVMTRKSVDDPGRPPGIILNAATSFWLPVSPARVFSFLRDDATRSEWDILSNGGDVQEMAHIANGRDHGNAVSLLRVNILVDSVPTAKLSLGSVATVNSLIACTVERIKAALAADITAAGGGGPRCPPYGDE